MKKTLLFASLSLLMFYQAGAQKQKSGTAQKTAQKKEQSLENEGRSREAWMEYMKPGEMHVMLQRSNGEFREHITIWQTPDGPPMMQEAVCTNSMILGGRYQQSVHKGNMMGMPFEGIGTMGYDKARSIFFSTWIDNMGTGIMYGEGKFDPDQGNIELKGYTTDPATGKTMDFREVIDVRNPNRMVTEMFTTVEGKEFRSMIIVQERMGNINEAPGQ